MKWCLVANAQTELNEDAKKSIREASNLVAVDGGYKKCLALGREPELLVGDGDSLESIEPGCEWIRLPCEKDQSDFEVALGVLKERGATEIYAYSCLDHRLDFSGDALWAAAQSALSVYFIERDSISLTLSAENEGRALQWSLSKRKLSSFSLNGKLSLFPLSTDLSLEAEDLKWPLRWKNVSLPTRSLSNEMTKEAFTLKLQSGSVAVVLERI